MKPLATHWAAPSVRPLDVRITTRTARFDPLDQMAFTKYIGPPWPGIASGCVAGCTVNAVPPLGFWRLVNRVEVAFGQLPVVPAYTDALGTASSWAYRNRLLPIPNWLDVRYR